MPLSNAAKSVLILGGVAALGAGVYLVTRKTTAPVVIGGGTCGCPTYDVCPQSDGSCPSGYQPDPEHSGCCEKIPSPSQIPVSVTFHTNESGASVSIDGGTPEEVSPYPANDVTFSLMSDTTYTVTAEVKKSRTTRAGTEICTYKAEVFYTTTSAADQTVDLTLVVVSCT